MSSPPSPAAVAPGGVIIVAGPFGSGKTEVALALADCWARDRAVTLADLDVVTPYFRSRDAGAAQLAAAVDVLAPEGEAAASDVPVIAARLAPALGDRGRLVIVDCGGDPVGATVLAQFRALLLDRQTRMAIVLNPRRPDTPAPEAAATVVRQLVQAAGLPLGGLVANGNMGWLTTLDDFDDGVELAIQVAALLGTEVLFAAAPEDLAPECALRAPQLPLLPIRRRLAVSWEGAPAGRGETAPE